MCVTELSQSHVSVELSEITQCLQMYSVTDGGPDALAAATLVVN